MKQVKIFWEMTKLNEWLKTNSDFVEQITPVVANNSEEWQLGHSVVYEHTGGD